MATNERRREARMPLTLPLRVQGHDPDGTPWEEMTSSADASFRGAAFKLKHRLEVHQALHLLLPLPKTFRRYDLSEHSYRTFALVRDVAPGTDAARVGVFFLGRHPPKDYDKNPGGRYLLPTDAPPPAKERRLSPRVENVFLNLKLSRLEADGAGGQEEKTVAENLGKKGARVMTTMPVAKGEVVVLEELGGDFRTRAEIRNVYIGPDRVPRLNLHFLDAEAPERLVAAR
jgi:PilZ domain-containing protein